MVHHQKWIQRRAQMRKVWLGLIAVLSIVLLGGCIKVETTVKLNRDGSGQIEEKMGLPKEMVNMAKSMPDQGNTPKPFSKKQFANDAKLRGEGVKLVSFKETEGDRMTDFEVVYAFDDINKVIIDQNQGNVVSSPGDEGTQSKEEPVRFEFTAADDSSTLKILLPKSDEGDFTKKPPKQEDVSDDTEEAGLEMMKTMFKGMHFAINVVLNGDIVETNATNVEGNTITLVDMDFDKLMDDNDTLKKLNAMQPESMEEAKTILEDIDGLKFEFEEVVTVKFK